MHVKKNSVVILVGPSGAGKTHFSKQLIAASEKSGLTSVHISSDQMRRQLIGNLAVHKSDKRMMAISKQAFDMVYAAVEAHASYPLNTDVIIVDSTGLDPKFRGDICNIANSHEYFVSLVVLDIPEHQLISNITNGTDVTSLEVGMKHLKRLQSFIQPLVAFKGSSPVVHYTDIEQYKAVNFEFSTLSPVVHANSVTVVGDVHESVDELKSLINKIPKGTHLVFVGDLFDKGMNTIEMIQYMNELKAQFPNYQIVMGNHERYIGRRLRGVIQPNDYIEATYMTAVPVLLNDKKYAEEFLRLYDAMVPYVVVDRGEYKNVIVTHAPCKTKYLAKDTKKAVERQANYRFQSRSEETMLEELSFIKNEASSSDSSWHVFGHVAHDGAVPVVQKNKIWLDTGCVHGGKLSAVTFVNGNFSFKTVPSKSSKIEKLITIK